MNRTKSAALLAAIAMAAIVALASLCGCATGSTKSLSSYTIYYENLNGGRLKNAANELNKAIYSVCGAKAPCYSTAVAKAKLTTDGYEILIGNTGDQAVSDLKTEFSTPMDYTVKVDGTCMIAIGNSPYATAAAVEKLISLIKSVDGFQGQDGYTYEYRFDSSKLNPLCTDESSFVPAWSSEYQPADWMDDLYESMYAVAVDGGRFSVLSHRGDFVYYPMCSLEGILSAILAGADVVELDFRLTKDNIPVVLHDEDLRVSTNCASMAGKNGLPTSYYVGSWTYEQLQQLNMVMQDTKEVTPYKICTCYEALLVAKRHGALLTWDDKADDTKVMVFAATTQTTVEDMLPLMLQTDTLEYFIYYYQYFKAQTGFSYWEKLEGTSEKFKTNLAFWKKCSEAATAKSGALDGVWGFWNDTRYKSWGYSSHYETADYWSLWMSEGKNQIWSNNIVKCCQYIAENYSAEDYSAIN